MLPRFEHACIPPFLPVLLCVCMHVCMYMLPTNAQASILAFLYIRFRSPLVFACVFYGYTQLNCIKLPCAGCNVWNFMIHESIPTAVQQTIVQPYIASITSLSAQLRQIYYNTIYIYMSVCVCVSTYIIVFR